MANYASVSNQFMGKKRKGQMGVQKAIKKTQYIRKGSASFYI